LTDQGDWAAFASAKGGKWPRCRKHVGAMPRAAGDNCSRHKRRCSSQDRADKVSSKLTAGQTGEIGKNIKKIKK
jgi:hypothetical protein